MYCVAVKAFATVLSSSLVREAGLKKNMTFSKPESKWAHTPTIASKFIPKFSLSILPSVRKVKFRKMYDKTGFLEWSRTPQFWPRCAGHKDLRHTASTTWAFKVSQIHMETLCGQHPGLFHVGVNASLAMYTFLILSLLPFRASMLHNKFVTFFKDRKETVFWVCVLTAKENLTSQLFCGKAKMILETGVVNAPRKFFLGYWSCALLGWNRGQKVRIWKRRCSRLLMGLFTHTTVMWGEVRKEPFTPICSHLVFLYL